MWRKRIRCISLTVRKMEDVDISSLRSFIKTNEERRNKTGREKSWLDWRFYMLNWAAGRGLVEKNTTITWRLWVYKCKCVCGDNVCNCICVCMCKRVWMRVIVCMGKRVWCVYCVSVWMCACGCLHVYVCLGVNKHVHALCGVMHACVLRVFVCASMLAWECVKLCKVGVKLKHW